MYLRSRTSFVDDDGYTSHGVFQAASYLLYGGTMYYHDEQRLNELWHWFRHNLRAPMPYKQGGHTQHIICWFKPTAHQHIQKMYEMAGILEEYGLPVTQVISPRPGYILYEDDHQVAVAPFRELLKQVR